MKPMYPCANPSAMTRRPYLPCGPQGFSHPRAVVMMYALNAVKAIATHCAFRCARNHQESKSRPYLASKLAQGDRNNHATTMIAP